MGFKKKQEIPVPFHSKKCEILRDLSVHKLNNQSAQMFGGPLALSDSIR